jgi:transglutaminase-like putative cysteine protease
VVRSGDAVQLHRRSALRRCALFALAPAIPAWLPAAQAQTPIERRIVFSLNVSNPTGETLEDQAVWLYLPAGTATQRLIRTDVAAPHRIERDVLGHSIAALSWKTVKPYASATVTVSSAVALARGSAEALVSPRSWLQPERFIESDAPEILRLAATLQRSTPRDSVRAIYEWVADNIRYEGYIADDLGAAYALRERRGDCTEYADLAVALARAQGLPARMAGGYVVERDTTLRASDYHNWAEIHVDGSWQVCDPQKRWCEAAGPVGAHYIMFRIYRDIAINAVGLAHRFAVRGRIQVSLA